MPKTAFSNIQMDISIEFPACNGEDTGIIEIVNTTGGTPPYLFALNDGNFTSNTLFTGLIAGEYEIHGKDADGCEEHLLISIIEPNELQVQLFSNTFSSLVEPNEEVELFLGVSTLAELSYAWFVNDELYSNESTITLPIVDSTTIIVHVFDDNACTDTDTLHFGIEPKEAIYIPNAFSPNADGENDIFTIFGLPNRVTVIEELKIFNRKGNLVFQQDFFPPNDIGFGWNGMFKGKFLQPQVFTYLIEYVLWNGEKEIKRGNVMLFR